MEQNSRRERGRRLDFDQMKEEEKEDRERMSKRERGMRVDEKVKPVAELARARTAGSPGTENHDNASKCLYDQLTNHIYLVLQK